MLFRAFRRSRRAGKIAKEFGLTRERLMQALRDVRGNQRVTSQNPEATYEALERYGRDLPELRSQGKLDPVIGRDEEIRRVIQVLSRRTKNNPVLIGEPGVPGGVAGRAAGTRAARGDGLLGCALPRQSRLARGPVCRQASVAGRGPPRRHRPAVPDALHRGVASAVAVDWFRRFEGAGLDGVMAKDPHGTYESNKRVMLKVKHDRECDCVVAGFRWHKRGSEMVGSLLLGLHDDAGNLQHVGVCASFTEQTRRDLVAVLTPYRRDALVDHPWAAWAQSSSEAMDSQPRRMPGGKSRWSGGKEFSWEPLRPELVVEVASTTSREVDFDTPPSFGAGEPTSVRAIVPTLSWKRYARESPTSSPLERRTGCQSVCLRLARSARQTRVGIVVRIWCFLRR